MIEAMKKRYGLSVRIIVRELGISYATLMRWKRRLARGQAPVEKPGPKKVGPLDLGELKAQIRDIEHDTGAAVGLDALRALLVMLSPGGSWSG